jgi:hypothetical protein
LPVERVERPSEGVLPDTEPRVLPLPRFCASRNWLLCPYSITCPVAFVQNSAEKVMAVANRWLFICFNSFAFSSTNG